MDCPSCGHSNRAERLYCSECGAGLGLRCAKCEARNEPGEKFCGSCGASLIGAEPSGVPPAVRGAMPFSLAGGRYRVSRFLGEGGRKRVYLAHDERLNRDAAVAMIKTEGLDAAGLARVRREARAMGHLGDHPHIVTIYDIGEEAGQTFIVSQYMAGGSVADLLAGANGHRLPLEQALTIADQICQALEHAHTRGVVHRDLKPANVWLTAEGTAKLGDFGLAVALDRSRLTTEGTMVGTVAYMPPEQATGREPGARSDLYSLGAMLYEMVTGRPPFVGDDTVSVISQHLNTPPIAPSWHNREVPPALESLIMQLLAKTPEDRPGSAGAVRDRIRRVVEAPMEEAPEPASRTGPPRPVWGRFVGRQQELAAIKSAVDAALGGQGALMLLVGEAGIGKTRLTEEASVYARLRGAQVLLGRCYEGEGAPAFWPWVQVIRSYVQERDPKLLMSEMGPGAADIAQVVTEVRERLPGLPLPPPVTPEQARFRFFDGISNFLGNAGKAQPLVIVLDDLHLADKPSLLLLQFLAREMRGARLLVLGTCVDVAGDATHPLSEVLATLSRERPFERIALRGLSPEETVAFVEAAGQQQLDERQRRLVGSLQSETGGNPFFMQEILRNLIETGHVAHRDGRWNLDVDSVEKLRFRKWAGEVVTRRLAHLSDSCRSVLTIAAIVGREFSAEILERVAEVRGESLLEALEEAAAARVIEEEPGPAGQYAFANDLVRLKLYDELSATRRARLHERVAGALEATHLRNPEPHLAAIAHHFLKALPGGDPAKAVDYAIRAAQRATKQTAYERATVFYRRAIAALDLKGSDDEERCDLLLAYGDAQWRAGETLPARETFEQAAAVARARGDAMRLARAALGYGTAGTGGYAVSVRANQRLIDLLEEALRTLGEQDGVVYTLLLARLALELYYTPLVERRLALSREAVDSARHFGDSTVLLVAMHSREWATLGPDVPLEERLESTAAVVRLARELGHKEMAYQAHFVRQIALLESGDFRAADLEADAAARVAEDLRIPSFLPWVAAYRGMRAWLAGRFDEADALVTEATTSALSGNADPEPATMLLGGQAMFQNNFRKAFAEFIPGIKVWADQNPQHPIIRCVLPFAYCDAGQLQEAAEAFGALATDDFKAVYRDANWLLSLYFLTFVCSFLGDARSAAVLYEMLLPYENRWITAAASICCGPATTVLGVLATVLGRYDDASRHFSSAIEQTAAVQTPPLVAEAAYEYAGMLLRRGSEGDRDKALALLNRALNIARETGMTRLLERILARKLDAQGVTSVDIMSSIDSVAIAVARERPDLLPHAAPDGNVTILFTDIEGSTEIIERLGDLRAQGLLHDHNALIRKEVAAYGGFEVKSQGDGFMIAFADVRRAVACALDIQGAFESYNRDHLDEPLRVRIGMHTGEVVKEADDFYGKNVVLAARIAARAAGGEILVSSTVKALTDGADGIRFGPARTFDLKGLRGSHDVYAVEREPASAL